MKHVRTLWIRKLVQCNCVTPYLSPKSLQQFSVSRLPLPLRPSKATHKPRSKS
uniref:ORF14 n=1 Tax=Cnaphalocrocis medinalis granulovirus TaxID=1750712 RepID=A0A0X9FH19_9BBAC|nr:ORF14 [Cnaphalocrocis medinalis granulovirus]